MLQVRTLCQMVHNGRLLSFMLFPVRKERYDDGGSYQPDRDGEKRVEVWGRDGGAMRAEPFCSFAAFMM